LGVATCGVRVVDKRRERNYYAYKNVPEYPAILCFLIICVLC
jgi:hypothetical protein